MITAKRTCDPSIPHVPKTTNEQKKKVIFFIKKKPSFLFLGENREKINHIFTSKEALSSEKLHENIYFLIVVVVVVAFVAFCYTTTTTANIFISLPHKHRKKNI